MRLKFRKTKTKYQLTMIAKNNKDKNFIDNIYSIWIKNNGTTFFKIKEIIEEVKKKEEIQN